jgi:hypothetical protein
MTFDQIMDVYKARDAGRTRDLYARLAAHPPRGIIGVNVLRAARNSEMAKSYRKGSATAAAYATKDWAIGELCSALIANPGVIAAWGWGRDPKAVGFEDVFYLDLPGAGQISFHNSHRREGPTYLGTWDGRKGETTHRVCRWVEAILNDREVITEGDENGISTGSERARDEGDAGEEFRGVAQEKQEALDL